ncbi:bifunctional aspartate transaminase/aspartate 4-decarboxylase [Pengzhenrongella phosphoraccumulans]|uniref:bifunctional aspartate transaminase/aspartate 4-decarboxylase n=1 Tax=Pengzhenrongella phosphoraccumulans TaxID=3114394 RepID=UPI00388EC70F
MTVELEGYELQAAIAAAAAASGRPVLDAGRGQPNWLATAPRDAAFLLGRFAVAESISASTHPDWGMTPSVSGIAARLTEYLRAEESPGASFLAGALDHGVVTFGFEPDAWVHELVRATLGDGYPSPNRILAHIERVLERYLVEVTGAEDAPPGTYQVFGTEGGAAAMAYVFRSLRENGVIRPGDKVAIATPVFTPYLQVPVLEGFGLDVVAIHAAHNVSARFTDGVLDGLLDPAIKVFFLVNPGNPDTRAVRPERLRELRDLVTEHRPDLVIVADTVYATFVEGFRGILADLPHNVLCVHSFSKNFGATGSRLGFIALHRDNALDRILAGQDDARRRAQAERYSSLTSDASSLPFMARMVADSREVALHNITGLATPDQAQMALFALAYLMPTGQAYVAATRAELAARDRALRVPLRVPPPGGQDSMYYALVDLLQVTEVLCGATGVKHLMATAKPADVPLRLAREHGVIMLPGQLYSAHSWDARVSLASLTADELGQVGAALAAVLIDLAGQGQTSNVGADSGHGRAQLEDA